MIETMFSYVSILPFAYEVLVKNTPLVINHSNRDYMNRINIIIAENILKLLESLLDVVKSKGLAILRAILTNDISFINMLPDNLRFELCQDLNLLLADRDDNVREEAGILLKIIQSILSEQLILSLKKYQEDVVEPLRLLRIKGISKESYREFYNSLLRKAEQRSWVDAVTNIGLGEEGNVRIVKPVL
jgi:hypothetical protein